MKVQWLYVYVLAGVVSSCHYNDKKLTEQYINRLNKNADTTKRLIVQDRTLYNPLFVDSLQRTLYPGGIKLENNYVVVGKDTTRFPADLSLKRTYIFSAVKDSVSYQLEIIRTNFTDLQFKFDIFKQKATVLHEQGTAILSPMFFLAAEMPDDDVTGEAYSAYPYTCYTPGHRLEIMIGIGRDDNDQLRASVSGTGSKLLEGHQPVLRSR